MKVKHLMKVIEERGVDPETEVFVLCEWTDGKGVNREKELRAETCFYQAGEFKLLAYV